MVTCPERGVNDFDIVQLMPLPMIIFGFIKIQTNLTFWCRFTKAVLEKEDVKRVSVCLGRPHLSSGLSTV